MYWRIKQRYFIMNRIDKIEADFLKLIAKDFNLENTAYAIFIFDKPDGDDIRLNYCGTLSMASIVELIVLYPEALDNDTPRPATDTSAQ